MRALQLFDSEPAQKDLKVVDDPRQHSFDADLVGLFFKFQANAHFQKARFSPGRTHANQNFIQFIEIARAGSLFAFRHDLFRFAEERIKHAEEPCSTDATSEQYHQRKNDEEQ